MIGNDIIDLDLTKAKTDWKRRGFLNKIFTSSEQEFINSSEDPFLTVWKLWSIKESAYKLNMKYDTSRRFNPSKIECHLSKLLPTSVTIGTKKYYSNTLQTDEYIYSYASEKPLNNSTHTIVNRASQDYCGESQYCHNLASTAIASNLNVASSEIDIIKSKDGMPLVYHRHTQLDLHLSLTHHGKYAAYSIVY